MLQPIRSAAAHSLSDTTRTMAVELDVLKADGSLAPGMYASLKRPVQHQNAYLLVPKTSIVTNDGARLWFERAT